MIFLLGPPDSKYLISNFVKVFSEQVNYATHSLKKAWEEELGIQFHARHHLIQFKVMHRLHYSTTKLHSIYPTVSPLSDRCKSADGSLSHLSKIVWLLEQCIPMILWNVWLCVQAQPRGGTVWLLPVSIAIKHPCTACHHVWNVNCKETDFNALEVRSSAPFQDMAISITHGENPI